MSLTGAIVPRNERSQPSALKAAALEGSVLDILERERCIIDGHGEVHDDDYDLRAFALLPAKE